jgi:hypothetical protein
MASWTGSVRAIVFEKSWWFMVETMKRRCCCCDCKKVRRMKEQHDEGIGWRQHGWRQVLAAMRKLWEVLRRRFRELFHPCSIFRPYNTVSNCKLQLPVARGTCTVREFCLLLTV